MVRLRSLLQCTLAVEHIRRPLKLQLALVDLYRPVEGEKFPWFDRGIDIGFRCYQTTPSDTVYMPIECLQASTIVSHLDMDSQESVLISMSCDKDGHKPEFWLDSNGPEDEAAQEIAEPLEDN